MKTIVNTFRAILLIACILMLSSVEGLGAKGKPQPNNNFQRSGAAGFSIGDKGYIGTGASSNKKAPCWKDFWEYDPTTDSWTQKADFGGTARDAATGISISDKGYIGMGCDASGYPKDFWQYDPGTNTWTRKADFGGGSRHTTVNFSIGNMGYVGTGYGRVLNGDTYDTKDFWRYDPVSNTWTRIADLGVTERQGAVGFSINGKGYVGTGIRCFTSGKVSLFNDFWEYDPGTNVWIQRANVGTLLRAYAVGFSLGIKGYIGTGNGNLLNGAYLNDFWEYTPITESGGDTWSQKADFAGTKRFGAVGFNIGTKGYIGTGYTPNGVYVQDFWEYDPNNGTAGTWTRKADLGVHKALLKDASTIGETEQVINNTLIVYPNPSNSTFNFRLQTMNEELINIKIYDMMGRLVYEYHSLSPDAFLTIGDNLNVGVYVAVVTQGEYRKTVKITKIN